MPRDLWTAVYPVGRIAITASSASIHTMAPRRILLTTFLTLWIAFLWIVPALGFDFGHTYQHWLGSLSGRGRPLPLPPLTAYVSLPILAGNWLFYAYFAVLLLVPIILAVRIWSIGDRTVLLEWFCYGVGIYLMFVVASVFVIAAGLWAPFALL